jgi:lysophospholipase L1-like esterase
MGRLTLKGERMDLKRSLLLLGLFLPAIVVTGQESPADPDPNRFADEIKAFAEWDSKNAVPAEPVLFVGSSSVRMWRTRDSFPDLPVVNRGFGGSHISDVIHFADRLVIPYKPRVIAFYAGDNDIAAGKSAQRVFEDYRKFVGLVHAKLSETRIVFLAIKPSESRWSFWPKTQEVNELVRDFSRKDGRLFYADLATPLLGPDGKPRSELFLKDKLHLSPAGYGVWTQALMPVLRQALESRHGVDFPLRWPDCLPTQACQTSIARQVR